MLQILISKITLLEQNLFKSKIILKFDKKKSDYKLKKQNDFIRAKSF